MLILRSSFTTIVPERLGHLLKVDLMQKKEFKVGDRVYTKVDMTDPIFGWLAARTGTIVEVRPDHIFTFRVNLDFLTDPKWKEWGTNPIPFYEKEIGHLEDAPWLTARSKE